MSRLNLAALARACYALSGTDEAWFEGLVEVLSPLLDAGLGIAAWPFQFGEWAPAAQLPVGVAPEVGRAMHAAGAIAPEEVAKQFFLGPRAQSACERIGRQTGLDEDPLFVSLREYRIRDFRTLTLLDASGVGLAFAAPAREVVSTSHLFRHRLERAGAHILAGFRLRRALGEIDAVLAADGKLLDAQHEAAASQHREALRGAVKAFDRASCQRGPSPGDDALDAWQALVAGRWSLVQSFESDGRRYLVARRNPPGEAQCKGLSALEAQALLLRAQGASFKLIAYELGLSAAAAHGMVRKGREKLGIDNENELPSFVLKSAAALRKSGTAVSSMPARLERASWSTEDT